MGTRQKLANTAKFEAQRFFHGDVMQTKDNLSPVLELFPTLGIDEADGKWCAAFAYYCCIKAGFNFPIKPHASCSNHLAGCNAWEEWALADENISYYSADCDFTPEPGDIVLYDRVFDGSEHDHIGIIIENKEDSIIAAEGNINNVSGIIERDKNSHIRAYIRIPDRYMYHTV